MDIICLTHYVSNKEGVLGCVTARSPDGEKTFGVLKAIKRDFLWLDKAWFEIKEDQNPTPEGVSVRCSVCHGRIRKTYHLTDPALNTYACNNDAPCRDLMEAQLNKLSSAHVGDMFRIWFEIPNEDILAFDLKSDGVRLHTRSRPMTLKEKVFYHAKGIFELRSKRDNK